MKKQTAISLFSSGAALGRALKVTRGAIHNWPEDLDVRRSDQVIGAAIRLNLITPEQAKELIEHERQRHERSQGIAHGRDDLGDSAGDCR
jgi:hypothetical protein